MRQERWSQSIRIIIEASLNIRSKQVFKARLSTLLDQAFDLLRSSPSSDKKGVGHVNNNQVINTKTGDETTGPRYNDATSDLLGKNFYSCENNEISKVQTGLTEVAVPKNARLVRFSGQEICERRKVANIIPTCKRSLSEVA
jgi:hypothetical protein